MTISSSRRKRLEAQWEASFAEVQRLEAHYRRGIDQLERFTLSDLTVSGCTQWFRLYLRVVDLNVQIRRGELRHRTARTPRFPRAHTTTGVPDAVYSGLSIDDANAVFKQLEDSGKVRQSKLELMSFKMDPFDTDVIQLLDERLTKCREQFLALRSRYYGRIELNGIDPHEQLMVLSSTTRPQVLAREVRACFNPSRCQCGEDAEPWEDFTIQPGVEADLTSRVGNGTSKHQQLLAMIPTTGDSRLDSLEAQQDKSDVGLLQLKRQFGFGHTVETNDNDALAQDAQELLRRQAGRFVGSTSRIIDSERVFVVRMAPCQLYQKKCRDNATQPSKSILELLAVKGGILRLNLTRAGLLSPDELHDVTEIVAAARVPVQEIGASNLLFTQKLWRPFYDLLKHPIVRKHVKRVNLRGLSLPRRSYFTDLLGLLAEDGSGDASGGEVVELDISYNTLSQQSTEQLEQLLRFQRKLAKLSLASCFPTLDTQQQTHLIESTRAALLACGDSLVNVSLDENAVHHSWLNALLSPESSVQHLSLSDVDIVASPRDPSHQHSQPIWDLHFGNLESLEVSTRSDLKDSVFSSFLVALIEGFNIGFMQLKHLELSVGRAYGSSCADPALGGVVVELLEQLHGYGALSVLSLSLDTLGVSQKKMEAVKRLLSGGVQDCEALTLSVGLVGSPIQLQELICEATLPKVRNVEIGVELGDDDGESQVGQHNSFTSDKFSELICSALSADDQFGSLTTLVLRISVPNGSRYIQTTDELFAELDKRWPHSHRTSPQQDGEHGRQRRRGFSLFKQTVFTAHTTIPIEHSVYTCHLTQTKS